MHKPTFTIREVVTLDMMLDGEDLQWSVVEEASNEITLVSGDYALVIRRDDLAALSARYPVPA